MKLSIASDLHLEFGYTPALQNVDDTDVLILAGDIIMAYGIHLDGTRARQYSDFLADTSRNWKHAIVVAGNHEFYNYKWYDTLKVLRKFYAQFSNVTFLEDDCVTIGGVKFVGSTLWTDMNGFSAQTLFHTQQCMNDFHCIRDDQLGDTKLRPATTTFRHELSLGYIKEVKADIVITHHLPSHRSVHEEYKHDELMNGAFASDLDEVIEHLQPKLWVHGHTHKDCDYMLGNTRVVCHPKGYPNERSGIYQPLTVEI